jgi:hypothetical protein
MSMSIAGKRSFRLAASLVAAGALTFAAPAAASTVVGAEHGKVVIPASWGHKAPVIDVTMTTAGFDLPDAVHAGFVTFRVGSPEDSYHAFQGVSVKPGYTVQQVIADFQLGAGATPAERAQGHRDLLAHATLIGGVVTTPEAPLSLTVPLDKGTYYFFDMNELGALGSAGPVVHTLTAHGNPKWEGMPEFSSMIGMSTTMGEDMPMFHAPDQIAAGSSTLIYNDSEELHEAVWVKVKDGITQAYLDDYYYRINNGLPRLPSPYASTQRGLQAMSPGRFAVLELDLPAGVNALLCLIPDEKSGLSHARMGMRQIMTLT